ncbi:hypothetical protein J2766_001177 [Agrobacterium tumefaciens]|uniref:Uncharacterized protein n=1 Tax=Agrobacterium tumefaciens TaxID=358 RepID=A0AAW8LSG5_AGRTU|nr:hypothetical protein [Agrobacterium tumefaciens]MBP2564618.1 hypothetical protein [Agrobacterium tumefaciens]MDR6701517.1 hypothetical protein [Agrobacterium tumefaciens]
MNYRLPRTSVDSLAKAAEERLIREKMAAARDVDMSVQAIVDHLDKMARSKIWWIDTNSQGRNARPAADIATQRLHLAALVKARDLLRKGSGDATESGG